jgi:hypothetical protein
MIIGGKQTIAQLEEKIALLVGNALMLPLQGHNCLASIGSALFPSGDTALRHTQAFLRLPDASGQPHGHYQRS